MLTQAPRILFAHVPFDGHFHPLTGLARHLADKGYDVRWYSGGVHADKIAKLELPVFPFKRALELNQHNSDELFPGRALLKGKIQRLKFDVDRFIERAPEYYEDLKEVRETFPFDMLICDAAFTGGALVKELMGIPIIVVGVFPLAESSKDLPPSGMGLTPANGFTGRCKHALLRYFARHFLFKDGLKLMNRIYAAYGLPAYKGMLFDALLKKADLVLQSGVPGFEYKRSDMGLNIRFAGALLPYGLKAAKPFTAAQRLKLYAKVVLVTQGTVEKDPEKLLIPTLEAFKDSPYFVVATTGGFNTELLRRRFPQTNILIEDFIAFDDIMPLADVYVTNGGYGGVMLSLRHRLPMVVAGVHEGKNEINARVGYFGLGVNLGTEYPGAVQVKAAVEEVFREERYQLNVLRLGKEFDGYDPNRITEQYVKALLHMYAREKAVEEAVW